MYSLKPSTNSDSITSDFPICNAFISSFSLIRLARTSKTLFNKNDVGGHSCLVPHLGGNAFTFLPLRMFAVGCCI